MNLLKAGQDTPLAVNIPAVGRGTSERCEVLRTGNNHRREKEVTIILSIGCGMHPRGRSGALFPSPLFLTRVKIASDNSSKCFVFVGAIPSQRALASHERLVALEAAYRAPGGGTVAFRRQPLEKSFERA
jgi:hypothetical protein